MSAVRSFRATRFGSGIGQLSLGVPAAAYPGRVATSSDLIVAVDRQQTSLLLPMGAADTSMTVLSASMIVAYNLLSIDNEIVKTTGPPAGNVVPVSRGFDGTTPAAHSANAPVLGLVDAWHHNALVAEVEAIETALGPNLSNVSASGSGSLIFTAAYNFQPQSPGGSLTVGTNVVTLSPVPKGLNGSDKNHWLYISGGTGTAEPVLITGGSAVSGASSGTVFFTAANTHSGAWTISSATGGIAEALQYVATAGGGTAILPPTTTTVYASIWQQSNNCCLIGQGPASVIFVAPHTFDAFPQWQWGGAQTACVIAAHGATISGLLLANFTIDMNGQNQSPTGLANGAGAGVNWDTVSTSTISGLTIKNVPNQASIEVRGISIWQNTKAIRIENCVVLGIPTAWPTGCHAINVVGDGHVVADCYMKDCPNGAVGTGSASNIVVIGNYCEIGTSTSNGATQAFYSDSSIQVIFIGNVCVSDGSSLAAFCVITDTSAHPSQFNMFMGNLAYNCGTGYQIWATGENINNTVISGGVVAACAKPLDVQQSGGFLAQSTQISDVSGIILEGTWAAQSLAAANHDIQIYDKGNLQVTATGAFSIGGFQNGFTGRELTVMNTSPYAMTLVNGDAGSASGNQIAVPGSANYTSPARASTATFKYYNSYWNLTSVF